MYWLLRLKEFTIFIIIFIFFLSFTKDSVHASTIINDTFIANDGTKLSQFSSHWQLWECPCITSNHEYLISGNIANDYNGPSYATDFLNVSLPSHYTVKMHINNPTNDFFDFRAYADNTTNNNYLFRFTNPGGGFAGQVNIFQVQNLPPAKNFTWNQGDNTIVIDVNNYVFTIFVNGNKIFTYTDNSHQYVGKGFVINQDQDPTLGITSIIVTDDTSSDLNIPYFQQTSPPWGSEIYDGADHWSSGGKTIANWGCALTSDAMILKYWGINKLPDGTPVDPGSLNTWLMNNNGYDDGINNGYIVPNAISKLSKLAKNINNITSFDALELHIDNGSDIAELTTDIGNGIPGMIGVNGNTHYIVAKGINGGSFDVNDPYYANRGTLNDGYNNTFASLTRYVPSSTDLSYIFITATPNIQLSLKDSATDSAGQQFDLPALKSDPDGTPSGQSSQVLFLSKPPKGEYKLVISGLSTESYKMNVYFYDKDGNTKVLKGEGVVGKNTPDTFDLPFDNQTVRNSTEQKIVTFDSMIGDIKNALDLHQINPVFAHSLMSLVNAMKRDSGLGKKTVITSELDFAGKAITLSNGKAVSNSTWQILLYDIQYLKSHL